MLRVGVRAKRNNSTAHTPTSFLAEEKIPDFMDMVIWGHEHECKIDPWYNAEQNFHIMQPGSSIATSLMPGEAVPKHVAVLSITGRDYTVEPIRLKTVRPFVMREIVLSQEKEAMKLAKTHNNRTKLTEILTKIVNDMIQQANEEWRAAQGDEERDDGEKPPLPLIRLRVEYTAPEGGNFDCENPQRFSNRFTEKVANVKDVVQFYRKKTGGTKKAQDGAEMPGESTLASLDIDTVKVDKLVREFLKAQSLTVLPRNSFSDAVSQFIDKDDKHAMETFLAENVLKQIEELMKMEDFENDLHEAMGVNKSHLEQLFADGHRSMRRKAKRKPRPAGWDSDLDGAWEDQPDAVARSDIEDDDEEEADEPAAQPTAKGRGKAAPKKAAAPAKKSAPAKNSRSKKKIIQSEEEDDEDVMLLDSDEDESQLFVKPEPPTRGTKKAAPAKAPAPKRAPARAAATTSKAGKQSQLSFSQPATQPRGATKKLQEVSDDDISDDDDAFEPAPTARSSRSRR